MRERTPGASPVTTPALRLAAAFRHVYETRMREVPILNPALAVEAVGFAPWDAHWLGCLITPWFMNLVLLPRDPDRWISLRPGEKRTYVFPAGTFEFIGGREEAIGEYQACSLFSPVLEFAHQEAARLVAAACLRALFDAENREQADLTLLERSDSLARDAEKAAIEEERAASGTTAGGAAPLAGIEAALATPMSKREFLHGGGLGRVPRR